MGEKKNSATFLGLTLLLLAASSFLAGTSFAQTYTWTAATGGLWGNPDNWSGGTVASGAENTADFSELGISGTVTVDLDSYYTIGNLIFGNTASSSTPGSWVLDNNGSAENVLTLAGATPTITINPLGTGASATISASLYGSDGLTIAGSGLLMLSGSEGYFGSTNVMGGTLNYTGGAASSSGGTLNVGGISGTGVVNFATSGTLTFGMFSSVGGVHGIGGTTGAGAINQSSGNVVFNPAGPANVLDLGSGTAVDGTYGSYVLSGGSLTVKSTSIMHVGYYWPRCIHPEWRLVKREWIPGRYYQQRRSDFYRRQRGHGPRGVWRSDRPDGRDKSRHGSRRQRLRFGHGFRGAHFYDVLA